MARHLIRQATTTIVVIFAMNAGAVEEGGAPLTDLSREALTPADATFDSLFEAARQHLASGQLAAGVALGYLALGKVETNADRGADRARAHLLISRLMNGLGYRAFERVHARAALRASGADGAPKREIYQHNAEVLARSLDYGLADFYLQHAFRQLREDAAVVPQPPAALVELLLSAASLELARANLQMSFDPAALDHLKQAQQHVDEAEALIDDAIRDRFATPLVVLRAQMLVGLSAHLPSEQEATRREALATAERMLSEFIVAREQAGDSHGDAMLRLRNLRLGILVQQGRHEEASQVTERILSETRARQRGDSDIALNMAIRAGHFDSSEQLLSLCDIIMRGEAARVNEIARMSGEAVAIASIQELRRRSMVCLSLTSRYAASEVRAAKKLLEISEGRRTSVGRAEAEFWRALTEQPDPDLAQARGQLIALRSQLSLRIDQGRHDALWSLIDQIQVGEEMLSVEPWWRDFKTSEQAASERRSVTTFAERLIGGSLSWDSLSDVEDSENDELASLAEIAERLGAKSALVEYVRIDEFDLERVVFRDRADYWAIVLRPPERIHAVKLGDAMAIEGEVRGALDLLSDPRRDPLDAAVQVDWMKRLHARLWQPFEEHLKDVERVHIVPDGALSLVPFAALSVADDRFLVERLTISLHGSAASIASADSLGHPKQGRVVVFADPEYGMPVAEQASRRTFQPLKHGPTEARLIQEIMGRNAVDVYTGADATEARLRTLVSPRILHLATHGSYDVAPVESEAPEAATLDTIARTSNYARYVERLTRSGLALRGANLLHEESYDDGWLTAYDVIGSRLGDTDLVVISACKSGLGARESGEGLMSIARSFSIAGASYVVTTLWPLSDAEAPRQIGAFYRFYAANPDPVAALRAMQLKRLAWYRRALRSEAPPAMWASYMIQTG